jgi:hypothetical protein
MSALPFNTMCSYVSLWCLQIVLFTTSDDARLAASRGKRAGGSSIQFNVKWTACRSVTQYCPREATPELRLVSKERCMPTGNHKPPSSKCFPSFLHRKTDGKREKSNFLCNVDTYRTALAKRITWKTKKERTKEKKNDERYTELRKSE